MYSVKTKVSMVPTEKGTYMVANMKKMLPIFSIIKTVLLGAFQRYLTVDLNH